MLKIKEIIIEINGQELSLSKEDAMELRTELNLLMEKAAGFSSQATSPDMTPIIDIPDNPWIIHD